MEDNLIDIKTLDFDYIINKKCNLIFKDSRKKINALLFFVDNQKMGLSIGFGFDIEKNKEISVDVICSDHLLRFETKTKNYSNGILYVLMPYNALKIQQREYMRVECSIQCRIDTIATGKIKNLSASGAFIRLDNPINPLYINNNDCNLYCRIDNNDIRIHCSIVEITNKFIRAKFLNLEEKTKSFLIQTCCNIDRTHYNELKK